MGSGQDGESPHDAAAEITQQVLDIGSAHGFSTWLDVALVLKYAVVVDLLIERRRFQSWRAYRTDTFLDLRWRWIYSGREIVRLASSCPYCDFQVDPELSSAYDVAPEISRPSRL